jgi:hypothetical protein
MLWHVDHFFWSFLLAADCFASGRRTNLGICILFGPLLLLAIGALGAWTCPSCGANIGRPIEWVEVTKWICLVDLSHKWIDNEQRSGVWQHMCWSTHQCTAGCPTNVSYSWWHWWSAQPKRIVGTSMQWFLELSWFDILIERRQCWV